MKKIEYTKLSKNPVLSYLSEIQQHCEKEGIFEIEIDKKVVLMSIFIFNEFEDLEVLKCKSTLSNYKKSFELFLYQRLNLKLNTPLNIENYIDVKLEYLKESKSYFLYEK